MAQADSEKMVENNQFYVCVRGYEFFKGGQKNGVTFYKEMSYNPTRFLNSINFIHTTKN